MGANTVTFVPKAIYTAFNNFILTTSINGSTNLVSALASAGYILRADNSGTGIGCNCAQSFDGSVVEKFELNFADYVNIVNDVVTAIGAGGGANFTNAQLISPYVVGINNLKVGSGDFASNSTFVDLFSGRKPIVGFELKPLLPYVNINNVGGVYLNSLVDGVNSISVGGFPPVMTGQTGTCSVYSVDGSGNVGILGSDNGTVNSYGIITFAPNVATVTDVNYFVSFNVPFGFLDSYVGSLTRGKMGIVDSFASSSIVEIISPVYTVIGA